MELTNEFNLKEIEQSAKDYLSKLDQQKMIDDSSDKRDKIMFIEGPPTLMVNLMLVTLEDVYSKICGIDLTYLIQKM